MNNKNYSKSANNRESDAQNCTRNDSKNRTEQKNKQNEVKSDVMIKIRTARKTAAAKFLKTPTINIRDMKKAPYGAFLVNVCRNVLCLSRTKGRPSPPASR